MRPPSAQAAAVPAAVASRSRATRLAAVRIAAIGLVVLVHTSTGPADPAFAEAGGASRALADVAYRVGLALAVPTFLLLAFMALHPRLAGARDYRRLVGSRCVRLLPTYLFWTAAYAALKVAAGAARLTPRTLLEYVVLGKSAAHLYYLPLLLGLTALVPAWLALARRPALAAAACALLPLGASYAVEWLEPSGAWAQAALGLAGNAVYAIAGLALVERWGGWEPPPERRALTSAGCLAAALLCGSIVAAHAFAEAGAGAVLLASALTRVARVGFPIASVAAVLSSRLRFPEWTVGLAPLAFGVYLVHPLVAKPLHLLVARVPALADSQLLLGPPMALLALAASFGLVVALMDTRLRRVLA